MAAAEVGRTRKGLSPVLGVEKKAIELLSAQIIACQKEIREDSLE
jgi:hypothetical protein